MQTCILSGCTITEALQAQNISATTCGEPVRNQAKGLSVMAYILLSLALVALLTRLYVRLFIHEGGSIGMDDWSILVAAIMGIPATLILTLGVVKSGLGRDIWTLTPTQITSFARWFYILQIGYNLGVPLLKQSLLFFYLRVFPHRPVRRILWGTIIFNIAYALVYSLTAAFGCTPVSYFWTSWDGQHKGTCIDLNAIAWSGSSISIFVDFWMLAVPLWQVKDLNMRRKQKISVGVMFIVGSFVTVVSIMRLHSLTKYSTTTPNPTWDFTSVAVWSTLEITIGIVCTCLPTVRILLIRLWPALNDRISRGGGISGSGSSGRKRTPGTSLGLSDIRMSGIKIMDETGNDTVRTNTIISKPESRVTYDTQTLDDSSDKGNLVGSTMRYSQASTTRPKHQYSTSEPINSHSLEWRPAPARASAGTSGRFVSNRLSSTFQFQAEEDRISSYSSKTAGKSTIGRIVEDYATDHYTRRYEERDVVFDSWPLDEPDNLPLPRPSRSRRMNYGVREQWPLREAGGHFEMDPSEAAPERRSEEIQRARSRSNPVKHIALA